MIVIAYQLRESALSKYKNKEVSDEAKNQYKDKYTELIRSIAQNSIDDSVKRSVDDSFFSDAETQGRRTGIEQKTRNQEKQI